MYSLTISIKSNMLSVFGLGIRCSVLVLVIRYSESCIRYSESCIRYSESCIWYSESCIRYQESLFLPFGICFSVSVFGIRYSVFRIRCSVFGIRYSVFSIRYSIFCVRCSVLGIRYSVLGLRCHFEMRNLACRVRTFNHFGILMILIILKIGKFRVVCILTCKQNCRFYALIKLHQKTHVASQAQYAS